MKQSSFWEKDSFLKPYDLIVVGAGIVGLSSALFYKQKNPGMRVLVLDKGSIPEGASTRNAGFACLGSITEHMADLGKGAEEEIKKRIILRYQGLQLLRGTLGDEAIGYEKCGGFELFTSHENFEEAAGYMPRFNQWMDELVGESEVYSTRELNGYPVIFNRLEGALHPGRMMQALVEKAMATGVAIRWNTRVREVSNTGDVHLEDAPPLHAQQVLVASNGFTKRIMPDLDIKPARGLVMVSTPWPNIPWKGSFNYDRGYIYFRNVGDRLLLGGARNIAAEEEQQDVFGTNPIIKEYLLDFAKQILKKPGEIEFEYEWSGIMGFTPTKTPVIKRLDDYRVASVGLSGMGIAIGTKVGQKAAEILGQP